MAKEKFDFIQPIKDIPKSLKGFPKNLIHIWKDPVNNSEEVKARKKEIFPLLYLFVGIFLIMAIVSAIFPDAQDVLMIVCMIPGFGAVACGFLLMVLKRLHKSSQTSNAPIVRRELLSMKTYRLKFLRKPLLLLRAIKPSRKTIFLLSLQSALTVRNTLLLKLLANVKSAELKRPLLTNL